MDDIFRTIKIYICEPDAWMNFVVDSKDLALLEGTLQLLADLDVIDFEDVGNIEDDGHTASFVFRLEEEGAADNAMQEIAVKVLAEAMQEGPPNVGVEIRQEKA